MTTLAQRFETALRDEPRRPALLRPRPASDFLRLQDLLRQHPHFAARWDHEAEAQFREFRVAEAQRGKFAYYSTTMKRMMAAAIAQSADPAVAEKLQFWNDVSVADCLAWRDVPTAPAKKLLPAIRRQMKEIYGVRLSGATCEWFWTVPAGSAQCTTKITFGGPYCQLAYERAVVFPDASRSRLALTWEEGLGEFRAQWDQMTGETMASDLALFFTFCREIEARIVSLVQASHDLE